MGRLIDADKLKEDDEFTMWLSMTPVRTGKQLKTFSELFVKKIDNAPTVEAIPVEWLLSKADWCDKNNGIFVSGAIRSAVDAWREEQNNGTNKP